MKHDGDLVPAALRVSASREVHVPPKQVVEYDGTAPAGMRSTENAAPCFAYDSFSRSPTVHSGPSTRPVASARAVDSRL